MRRPTHLLPALVAAPSPRLALLGGHEQLTYADLHDQAARVARAVATAAADVPAPAVGLLLDHDTPAIVAALGVLAAGGHVVAVRADDPVERSAATLCGAGVRVLVTEARHAGTARVLAARLPTPPVLVDVAQARAGRPPRGTVDVAPDARCLIVATSGSTGAPRLVWHDHASIAHNASTYVGLAGLGPHDRLSLLHGLATMASATTLWGGLRAGATIVPRDPRAASRDRLLEWIATSEITGLHLVPTLFRRLLTGGDPAGHLTSLRFVRLGGEAVTRADWELWRAHCPPDSRLHVGLATSETGLVRHAVHTRTGPRPPAVLPVGDPVPDKDVDLVDGRIVVRGRHLFGGYHGDDATTAAVRRVEEDGRVVFRGADLGRWGEDGALHHVGRADEQVKIAGHRVEPAEVEHALRTLPWVRDAAVVTRQDVPGLAAFVTSDGQGLDEELRTIRARLRERLPAYMVPASVEALDELPLLAGGKVDRRALAARPPAPAPPPTGPRSPVEETLLEIVGRVLETTVDDVHADVFVDLGGDSLDAVQVLSEVAEVFGTAPVLDALARTPTVAGLADGLLGDGWAPPADGTLTVNGDGTRVPVFAICGLYGHALRLLLVGRALGPDQPLHALQPPAMDWTTVGATTIPQMAAHYADVIRRRCPLGPYHLLGTSFGGVLAFEVARLLRAGGAEVGVLALVDTRPPACVVDGRPQAPPRAADRDVAIAGARADHDPLVAMGGRVAAQHDAALARHVLREPHEGRILLLACEQPAVAPADDRRLLWRSFATGGLRVAPVPGWHGSFHRDPQLSAVAAAVRAELDGGTAAS